MPQGTEEQNIEWEYSDHVAITYLGQQGFQLTKDWHWIKPSEEHQISVKEFSAINYLIDEWDFGGVVSTAPA